MKWIQIALIASVVLPGCAHEPRCPRASPQVRPCPTCQAPVPVERNPLAIASPPSEPMVSMAVPSESNNPALTRGEPPPQRKSFVDTTAQPFFGHAEDYSWLQGQVEYSCLSKCWRLRYASVDEEDCYGGSVNLIENELLHKLKDGQQVRVQGRLTKVADVQQAGGTTTFADGKNITPHYRVDSLRPVEE